MARTVERIPGGILGCHGSCTVLGPSRYRGAGNAQPVRGSSVGAGHRRDLQAFASGICAVLCATTLGYTTIAVGFGAADCLRRSWFRIERKRFVWPRRFLTERGVAGLGTVTCDNQGISVWVAIGAN